MHIIHIASNAVGSAHVKSKVSICAGVNSSFGIDQVTQDRSGRWTSFCFLVFKFPPMNVCFVKPIHPEIFRFAEILRFAKISTTNHQLALLVVSLLRTIPLVFYGKNSCFLASISRGDRKDNGHYRRKYIVSVLFRYLASLSSWRKLVWAKKSDIFLLFCSWIATNPTSCQITRYAWAGVFF